MSVGLFVSPPTECDDDAASTVCERVQRVLLSITVSDVIRTVYVCARAKVKRKPYKIVRIAQ